uniref:Uncharacterized protein n=1 Tax=Oryza sativa subsp. japonica TaxID=39947 RepID=Q5Z7D3_ORYSJ|nr:hypothetical protein [Oryza sativa Japonica Group]
MKMKKIVDDDKRNRHDEEDDVGDPANSSVATNDNDKDAHQHLHSRSTVKICVEGVQVEILNIGESLVVVKYHGIACRDVKVHKDVVVGEVVKLAK